MSARRGKRPVEVLPPAGEGSALSIAVNAANCRCQTEAVRRKLLEFVMPDALRLVWARAKAGHFNAFIVPDNEEGPVDLVLDELRDELVKLGFMCRGGEVEIDRRHYIDRRTALEVSWRVGAS